MSHVLTSSVSRYLHGGTVNRGQWDDTKCFVFCDTDFVFSDRILSSMHFVKGGTFVSLTKTSASEGGQL